jgi:hypothetical protein
VHTRGNFPIDHPEIAPGQARLTPEFFAGGLPKKKIYLGGMSILSILLSLEPGCHTDRDPRAPNINVKNVDGGPLGGIAGDPGVPTINA